VAEYSAAGTLTTQYIHGPRVDEILAKVTPASTTFPLPDALGSTIAVTDASGAVLERVHYLDAFGTPTFRSGTGVPLPDTSTGTRFLFTGREWFARLGLYDYRNRTYSPRLGRFVQTDPIRFAGDDVNLYRYAGNSVVALRDPSGLKWEEVGGTERIVVGWKRTGSIRWIIGPTDSIGLGIVEAGSASYEATVSIDCKCGTETRKASGVRRVADRETSLSEDALFVGKAVSGLSPVGPSGPSSGSLAKVGTLIAGVIASGAGNTLPNPVTVPPGSDPSAATAEVDANVPKAASDGVWAGGSPCNKL
jgi:RHS repeat-associated protein